MNNSIVIGILLWTCFFHSTLLAEAKQPEQLSINQETVDSLHQTLLSLLNTHDYEAVYSYIEKINRLTDDANSKVSTATLHNIALLMERIPDYDLSLKYLDKAIAQANEEKNVNRFLRYRSGLAPYYSD